jgi:hypothetical protein
MKLENEIPKVIALAKRRHRAREHLKTFINDLA